LFHQQIVVIEEFSVTVDFFRLLDNINIEATTCVRVQLNVQQLVVVVRDAGVPVRHDERRHVDGVHRCRVRFADFDSSGGVESKYVRVRVQRLAFQLRPPVVVVV
jgi:hypothetical protein